MRSQSVRVEDWKADWIGFDRYGLVIVEAKGSFDSRISAWWGPNALPPTVETALNQAERTILIDRYTGHRLKATRWAVASRWGTENNEREPTLIAIRDIGGSDLDENEEAIDGEGYQELADALLCADMEGVKDGLTVSTIGDSGLSQDSQDPLPIRICGVSCGPSYSAAFGPFGQQPLRNRDDLETVRAGVRIGAPVAVASLSEGYYRHIVSGRRIHPPAVGEKSWLEDDDVLRRRSQLRENARDLVIERHGLTAAWLDRDQDIDLMN